jgi:hypothetical protein
MELATADAKDFKTRVMKHDRKNSFSFENIAAMKVSVMALVREKLSQDLRPGSWPAVSDMSEVRREPILKAGAITFCCALQGLTRSNRCYCDRYASWIKGSST